LGGLDGDLASAIAIHPKTGDIYVAGQTSSNNFPKTAGGAQASYGGSGDGFVAQLTADLAASSSSDKKTKQNPSNSKVRQSKKKRQQ
jgi:hypothetical protein